ncbi:tetraspanin-8-like [Xyrichtys novacula]|nr:tetraspanin-8-like [Xyrichtys novacula]
MAKVNGCLKCIFTGFNIFFAIVGGAIIGLALLSQVYTNTSGSEMEGRTTSLLSLYILGTVTMIVAILGAYGANKENKVCLIVFLVCMIVGALAMLRAGFVATAARPLVEPQLEEKFRQLLPLNEAPEEAKAMADGLQTMAHCCGLFSYNDWGNDIPDSCMCDEEEQEEGLCQSVGYRITMTPKKSIYSQTCFPIIMYYVMLLLDVVMGVAFTLASLAILGMILSSIIIHQLRHPDRPTVLLSVPAVFTPSTPKYQELQYPPPKYQELHNPPPY